MTRWIALLLAVLAFATSASSVAAADLQITQSPATAPILGRTVRGTAVTTFSVSTAGAVTRKSGDAIRLSGSSVTPPTVTIGCGLLNLSGLCALRYVRVTITPVTGVSPARITRLRIGPLSGGASYRTTAPSEGGSLTFDLNPLGLLSTATFSLGMDVELGANAASGAYTYDYIVTVQFV